VLRYVAFDAVLPEVFQHCLALFSAA